MFFNEQAGRFAPVNRIGTERLRGIILLNSVVTLQNSVSYYLKHEPYRNSNCYQ